MSKVITLEKYMKNGGKIKLIEVLMSTFLSQSDIYRLIELNGTLEIVKGLKEVKVTLTYLLNSEIKWKQVRMDKKVYKSL